MSVTAITSQQFGQLMIQGLVEAYGEKFAADPVRSIVEIITYKNTRRFSLWFRAESGDIDLFVARAGNLLTLGEMFPTERRRFETEEDANLQCPAFAAEFKSNMADSPYFDGKIETFVNYYNKVLSNTYFLRSTAPQEHRDAVNQLRADASIPILFVYNGVDNVRVRNKMMRELTAIHAAGDPVWQIRGHRVIILYCESGTCTSWARILRLQNRNRELEERNHQLEELNHQLEELLVASGIPVPPV